MMMNKNSSAWIRKIHAGGEKIRMFCFPYAGGSPHIFYAWRDLLPNDIGLYAIQLPGRGRRLHDRQIDRMEPIVDAIVGALEPFHDLPFVFFGHSMGALIAFETARALRRSGAPLPAWLFASGFQAPHIEDRSVPIHDLSDEAFMEKLKNLEGTPPEVLQNREILELILPTLRADFTVVDTYRYRPEPPLDCPITAFCGVQDSHFGSESTADWRTQTSNGFAFHKLPGGHFFIHTAQSDLLRLIVSELEQLSNAYLRIDGTALTAAVSRQEY